MTYYCEFIGRRSGAIGSTYGLRQFVEAPDAEAARAKLYETFEHISRLEVVPAWPANGEGVTV